MSRGLPAVLAVLFLSVALTAFAGPDDPFDASAAEAFAPGQKEFVLALDGGRYTINDGRLFDARSHHALTNGQVADLLANAKGTSTGDGATGPTDGTAPDGDKATQRAGAIAGKTEQAAGNFDGAGVHSGSVGDPPPPGNGVVAATPVDTAVLQAQLVNRLVFKGNANEKAAMSTAIADILRTKSGRDLATQFVAEKGTAEIVMEPIVGSTMVVSGGRTVISGSGGHTDVTLDPPRVTLNRDYLLADPDYRRIAMAGTLAHEMFGHGFQTERAKKAGLAPAVNYYYRGDEIGAELIGWTVETELSGKVPSGDPDGYLADPESYYRGLWGNQPYYVMILSPNEMKDPLPALKARRAALAADRTKTVADQKDMYEWRPIIRHFVDAHGIARARFRPCDDYLFSYDHWATDHLRALAEISSTLESKITQWSSPAGATELAQVKAGGNSEYLRKADETLAARRAELIRLRDEAAARGPGAGQVIDLPDLDVAKPGDPNAPIKFAELVEMFQKDQREHPEHWKK